MKATLDKSACLSATKITTCTAPILASPDFNCQFLLQTDASDRGIGAVLSQVDDNGIERPVAYYSKNLLPREERYSMIEKECLAIKSAIEAFQVQTQTYHRALLWLNQLKDKNSRLTQWSLSPQPFKFKVTHRVGTDNSNADTLSRAAPTLFDAGEGGRDVMDSLITWTSVC